MNLTQLDLLSLSDNNLGGTVSPSISQLKHLTWLGLNGNPNLHIDIDTLLKNGNLIYLDLAGVPLTIPRDITATESVAKLTLLSLDSCNLTEFPPFLASQDELRVLLLSHNRLQGVIPQWFVNKTKDNLLKLDLSCNFLTGFEQPAVILPWSNLEILYLLQNQIQGSLPIPPNSLMIYLISNNLLTGDIPQEFCRNAIALNYLDLSFNRLSGRVPECIGQLAGSLEIINLQGNNFDGIIPSVYPKSCKLKMINLSQNRLTGVVPRSLANCEMLEVLDMGNNQINDTFPSWLGSLPNLHILVLRQNNFHGKIGRPKATFGFQSLHILDLSHNFHIGGLPSYYFQMWYAMKVISEALLAATVTVTITLKTPHNLFPFPVVNYSNMITITNKGNDLTYTKILNVFRGVDFSGNKFTGRIPDFIGQLKGLQAINLSNNNLKGGIPSSLANIRDLESLDLSNNKLSGEIPQQLTQLKYLTVCNVSYNLLVGPLPQGNQFDTFDNSLFDGNLGLCGGTLSRKCGNADEPPSSGSVSDNEGDDSSNTIDWVVRSLGCVNGFMIGYVIGKYITDKNHEWFVETFRRSKRRTKTKPRRRS